MSYIYIFILSPVVHISIVNRMDPFCHFLNVLNKFIYKLLPLFDNDRLVEDIVHVTSAGFLQTQHLWE